MADFIVIEHDMSPHEIADFSKFLNILVMCHLIHRHVFLLGFMF